MSNRNRFPRSRRLRAKSHFDSFFKRSKRLDTPYLTVYYSKAKFDVSKIAVVAGKRLFPRAVTRNFCKRRLRSLFRCNQSLFSLQYDYVLVSKRSLPDVAFSEIESVVRDAFSHI